MSTVAREGAWSRNKIIREGGKFKYSTELEYIFRILINFYLMKCVGFCKNKMSTKSIAMNNMTKPLLSLK